MRGTDLIILRVGQLSALLFLILLIPLHPYPGSFVIKAIPAIALAIVVFRNLKTLPGYLLLAGLLLSAAGDVILDLDRVRFFVGGLGAFLVAHCLFTASFFQHFRFSRARLPFALIVVVYSLAMGSLLQDIPVDKYLPVMIYIAAISIMVVASIFVTPFSPWLVLGTVLFLMSDTIIAINKFIHPIPYSTIYNIGMYFLALFVIVHGFLRAADDVNSNDCRVCRRLLE
ncbi:MAG: lysoplasmalogenase [Deltaproteobacteria bacterium]|nr:lysoplasmalogenase [Deltaproteobacteria bacterium]